MYQPALPIVSAIITIDGAQRRGTKSKLVVSSLRLQFCANFTSQGKTP